MVSVPVSVARTFEQLVLEIFAIYQISEKQRRDINVILSFFLSFFDFFLLRRRLVRDSGNDNITSLLAGMYAHPKRHYANL